MTRLQNDERLCHMCCLDHASRPKRRRAFLNPGQMGLNAGAERFFLVIIRSFEHLISAADMRSLMILHQIGGMHSGVHGVVAAVQLEPGMETMECSLSSAGQSLIRPPHGPYRGFYP